MNKWTNEQIKELKNIIKNTKELDYLDLEIDEFNADNFNIDELEDAMIMQIYDNNIIYHCDAYEWLVEHNISHFDEAIESGNNDITSIANYYMHDEHVSLLYAIIYEWKEQQ